MSYVIGRTTAEVTRYAFIVNSPMPVPAVAEILEELNSYNFEHPVSMSELEFESGPDGTIVVVLSRSSVAETDISGDHSGHAELPPPVSSIPNGE